MIKDALEYLVKVLGKDRAIVAQVDSQPYVVKLDGTLGDPLFPPAPPTAGPLLVATLTGFADACKAKIDDFPEQVAIHVEDYQTVSLVSTRGDEFGRRRKYVVAKCGETNPFPFGGYQVPEKFILSLHASFLFNDTTVKLIKLASTLTSENSIATADDGISQVVTVKQGTVTRTQVELPPRIPLIPWRTFREANPVESEFLLRMQGKPGELPTIALIEIDGGRWKLDTVNSIAKWLSDALPDARVIA